MDKSQTLQHSAVIMQKTFNAWLDRENKVVGLGVELSIKSLLGEQFYTQLRNFVVKRRYSPFFLEQGLLHKDILSRHASLFDLDNISLLRPISENESEVLSFLAKMLKFLTER